MAAKAGQWATCHRREGSKIYAVPGQPAVSILRAEGATAASATMRAYGADHDAQALTPARWTLGWIHAVLDLVDKPCTAGDPERRCGGREYQAHSCPCHHWKRAEGR